MVSHTSTAVEAQVPLLKRLDHTLDVAKHLASKAVKETIQPNVSAFISSCDGDPRLAVCIAAPVLLGLLPGVGFIALSFLASVVFVTLIVGVGVVALMAGGLVSLAIKSSMPLYGLLSAQLYKAKASLSPRISAVKKDFKINLSTVLTIAAVVLGAHLLPKPRFVRKLFRPIRRQLNARRITRKVGRGATTSPKVVGRGFGRGAQKIGVVFVMLAKGGMRGIKRLPSGSYWPVICLLLLVYWLFLRNKLKKQISQGQEQEHVGKQQSEKQE